MAPYSRPSHFLDVAEMILSRSDEPLSCHQIVDLALDENLLRTTGRTPRNTLTAALIRDIQKIDGKSRFFKYKLGLYGLKSKHRK